MYVGRDFDPSDPNESEIYTLDFVNDVAAGETLTSATWTCTVVCGVDTVASSRVNGAAAVSVTQTSQRITGLLPGTKYRLQALALTTLGNTKSLYSHVECRTPR